ncbi:PHA/PHB synthase family protein [Qipengyuania atrilutea]|uniref:Class I poly(R)-hydroxyalkanoic acid synthase n=1 Tax=Qipengyuania atrilutea TaxID=2744473 RepID=A0A850H2Z5_9SPHN|nr:class I poly(R)-hydroxyalkanoic acid synthase [Actirhodobacter atriluteus]NVD45046.1 class I poly(R)-hydroxyalkanoic acid synthase [Actirhodobacter atriluteus]
MTDTTDQPDQLTQMFRQQVEAAQTMMAPFAGGAMLPQVGSDEMEQWTAVATNLQAQWAQFQSEAMQRAQDGGPMAGWMDPAQMMTLAQGWAAQWQKMLDPQSQMKAWDDGVKVWQAALGKAMPNADASEPAELPHSDKRFKDEKWRGHPAYILIHQTYLMIAEKARELVDTMPGLDEDKREQMRFFSEAMVDAVSPANFAVTNPVVLQRTIETGGQNLIKGMEHFLNDLRRGQLTHTDANAFKLGENIAVTPGKVVHETPIYQLIQYTPTTDKVLETPLLIFPPWINRFYILDLNEKKSFVRWALEQGISVFMVSWKSADTSMAEVIWDDYVRAQIEAIDHVRERLDVEAVHAIGYCVAGTTLAATLSLLVQRGGADKVKSATFFTAQVDFEKAGELLNFVDDTQIAALEKMTTDGYVDGRVMAATFNMLRGTDLIWNYVVNNYLLGEDYPAFDLLHWNGDVTNLPAKWHQSYLKDLYRDNKLVQPGAIEVDGTPIDLTKVKTPTYIQAGKEDHIAPAESVWRLQDHFAGPVKFVLAGSGHIAGVVNPPEAKKYQFWTNENEAESLADFVAGADEHPGSWWPNWLEWIKSHGSDKVPAKGKRKPGGKGDTVIEDAPGRYVMSR